MMIGALDGGETGQHEIEQDKRIGIEHARGGWAQILKQPSQTTRMTANSPMKFQLAAKSATTSRLVRSKVRSSS